ncbi:MULTISPECIES: hypothetical protein [Marichromatium]|uniref:Uncharacterized protein n=1 Tax=Marichromatium gracile TaxID=1048 RepID=A0A4R4AGA8_MARGR|nr:MULTISPECIES: hypothetical protein [Marichromatium]MBO8084441.1 hypothetical protein [Marichromatium sp.]MBK1709259.1 hypothetical protein [Marichromatium gracile]RNE90821.1 hypothetical protein EBL84_06020 [Marichromatium sp. AB31]RNE94408.1 hypothetical protein EBL85_01935 [Marichromatium sp. AB32]TCW38233.1 hypothetical protein EDC29_102124 [Marichromatium gracile]
MIRGSINGTTQAAFTLGAALLLAAGSWYASDAQQRLQQARYDYQSASQTLSSAAGGLATLERWTQAAAGFERWRPMIEAQSLRRADWSERQLRVESRMLSRQQVDAYLLSTAPDADGFFITDALSIRANGGEPGLFTQDQDDDGPQALQFTLLGTYYSR